MSVTGSLTIRRKRRGYLPEDWMHLFHVVDINDVSEKHGQDDLLCVRMTGRFHRRSDPIVGGLSSLREYALKLGLNVKSCSMIFPNAGVAIVKSSKHTAIKHVNS